MQQQDQEQFNLQIGIEANDRASTIGEGYLPRGIYRFSKTKVTQGVSESGKPVLRFSHEVVEAFVLSEDGSYPKDASLIGRTIKKTIVLPDGQNSDHDGYRRSDLLGAMVGVNQMTRKQANEYTGPLNISQQTFNGREGQCLYDPPKAGQGGFPDVKYLDMDIAQRVVKGEVKPQWPQDKKATRAAAGMAAGATAAGSLLAGQSGLPTQAAGGGFGGLPTGGAAPTGGFGAPTPDVNAGGAAAGVGGFGGGAPAGGAPAGGGWS